MKDIELVEVRDFNARHYEWRVYCPSEYDYHDYYHSRSFDDISEAADRLSELAEELRERRDGFNAMLSCITDAAANEQIGKMRDKLSKEQQRKIDELQKQIDGLKKGMQG